MELVHYHSLAPLTVDLVAARLHEVLAPGLLHRRATLGVAVHGPWRPADVWDGAVERLVWTVSVENPGGALLTARGEEVLGDRGITRRQAPVTAAELLARRFGDGLVLVHSDPARLAYAAVYRERHLAWSLMLIDRARLVRCDGEVVVVEEPPRRFPEEDRAGVLLAGLQHWLREPVEVDPEGRILLADTLGALPEADDVAWLVQDGEWFEDRRFRKLA